MTTVKSTYLALRPWGVRGMVLVTLGIMWMGIGLNYALVPLSPQAETALAMPLSIAPQQVWGYVFICAGLLACISSRWPPHQDTWGYVALGASSMWWSCSYVIGLVDQARAGDDFVRGGSGALVWLAVSVLLWAVSRLAEPVVPKHPRRSRTAGGDQ